MRLDAYFQSPEIYRRSMTVLEIGAGTAQPLARTLGDTFLMNDKYRCALIRINPIKERLSQFADEQKYFKELIKRQRQQRYILGSNKTVRGEADFTVKNKLEDDNRHVVLVEEKKYAMLKNEMIEIQLGAEEGLTLLNEYIR